MKLTSRPDLQPALAYFTQARDLRLLRFAFIRRMADQYGTAGKACALSGGHYSNWPERDKATVRTYVRQESAAVEAGFSSRPTRVRSSTMRALYQLVMK